MKKVFTKQWLKAAGIRALKTTAQSSLAAIGATAVITEVNWAVVAGTAVMAGVCSILTSLAGLPEVSEMGE